MGSLCGRAAKCVYASLFTLITDSQQLVSKAVIATCKKDLKSDDEQVQAAANKRIKILETWRKCPHPFAWDDPGTQGMKPFKLLVQLLPDVDGLKNNLKKVRYSEVAGTIVGWGKGEILETQAPLVKNGICPTTLRHTVPITHEMLAKNDAATKKLWETGLEQLRINFLPWRGDGPNARVPKHEFWAVLQKSLGPILMFEAPELNDEEAADEIARTAAKEEPSAPWTVPDDICEMGPLWEKIVLPSDWSIKNASLHPSDNHKYVSDAYYWVSRNFDGTKTEHRLGMVLGIMFSRVLPKISHPKNAQFENLSLDDLNRAIRELPWIECTNHKGFTSRAPFITMMSTYIICMLDEDSPLRKHLEENNNSFGIPWTEKHGESYLVVIDFFLNPVIMPCRR
jgi:hypothetical protein